MAKTLLIYTREPIDNILYDPRLAYSMHIGYVDEKNVAHALNHNSGVLFVKATENEDGSLNPKSLEKPYVFSLSDGSFGVLATRIEGDGGKDTQSEDGMVLFLTKDLVRYTELGLVKNLDLENVDVMQVLNSVKSGAGKSNVENSDAGKSDIEKTDSGKNEIADCIKAAIASYEKDAVGCRAEAKKADISGILGCIPMQLLSVSDETFAYLTKKFVTPEICGMEYPEEITAATRKDAEKVMARAIFTDGTKVNKKVKLDLSGVDFTTPGLYKAEGIVTQNHFDNPIAIDRADPDVFFWKGKYYYIATNDADQNHTLYLRESDTLEGIASAEEHLILDSTTYEGIGGLLWAPEFHEVEGRLYIFHAATRGEFFAEESRLMTLREGGDPKCKEDWSRPERIVRMDGSELCEEGKEITLDMTCFKWEDSYYVIWSQRQFLPKDLGAWLYIAKLNPEKPWMLASDPIVLSKPDYGWGNNHTFVEEGPFALMRGDVLYITFSAAAVDSSYVVSFLEIRKGQDLLVPSNWRKCNYPILTSRHVEGEYGTGHNAYVIDETGTVWNTYHARFGAKAPRSSSIRRVHFDVDGEPMLDVTEEKDLKPEFTKVSTTIRVVSPGPLKNEDYRYDSFAKGTLVENKKKNHLPAMGWNSWNAFGSSNTEALTKAMADCICDLELDKLGYKYVVLDDGCYLPERRGGKLGNETVKFPSGFRALADYIHGKGLAFGMYNDIGTNLCAGAAVGTCDHEMVDAQSYIDWGVDFLKVDNCYYLWDNATFSDAANAKYVYAPHLYSILVKGENGYAKNLLASDGTLTGSGASMEKTEDGAYAFVKGIGTFDGTGPWHTPVGPESGELRFVVEVPEDAVYELQVVYQPGTEPDKGSWLQVAVGEEGASKLVFDNFLLEEDKAAAPADFLLSKKISLPLSKGENVVRLMNHRRQENTLSSYGKLLEGLNAADPNHDIIYSICEWGKTQPQNWGYKVGDSWRILNDITFMVGRDGDAGRASWTSDYTTGVTVQYNKAVIMDEFAGLDKGWNDPDMMMIGMNGLTEEMNRTHMAMWCMMNSPLMLGMDLRNVKKNDTIWNIISNRDLIALNQDALGVQAKRVKVYKNDGTVMTEGCDTTYLVGTDRVDILAKPLADGSIAVSFINLNETDVDGTYEVSLEEILAYIGKKMAAGSRLAGTASFHQTDLWTGEEKTIESGVIQVKGLKACQNVTVKIK